MSTPVHVTAMESPDWPPHLRTNSRVPGDYYNGVVRLEDTTKLHPCCGFEKKAKISFWKTIDQ